MARIEELTLEPAGEPSIRIVCHPSARPTPGQAALATVPGSRLPLRKTLFPTRIDADGFVADLPPDLAWRPGMRLDLLSPIGRGFSPPPNSRHWLLIGSGPGAAHLLPLIPWGLAQEASIVLATSSAPPGLTAEVEVIPEHGPAIEWADYIAIEVKGEGLSALDDLLPKEGAVRNVLIEILVTHQFPCGIGVCAACAVPVRGARGGRGPWNLACVDGPVFRSADLVR
jgi:dihydroorotate dehydrogenase electron transfer subunit